MTDLAARLRVITPSVVRTITPIIVGWLISLPVVAWLGLDSAQVEAVVQAIVTAIWYVIARLAETYAPRVGQVLLGLGVWGAPAYEPRHRA